MHVAVTLKIGASFGKYKHVFRAIKAIFEEHGWRLHGSFSSLTGRTNSVVNIWEVPNLEALQAGLHEPRLKEHLPLVREVVENEVITLMSPFTVE
jgi:hypothetical protein